MTPQDKLYFAVRQTDGKEWIDVNTWGYVIQTTIEKHKQTDNKFPHWEKNNKVVRISQFKLTEIKY